MVLRVYFLKLRNPTGEELVEAGQRISETFKVFFGMDDKVAIKVHFGERDSKTRLNPLLVKEVYKNLKPLVRGAVLIDCNVLYKGDRSFGSSHKRLAEDNGFDFAPIVIADGEKGENEMGVEVNLKHFKKVRLGGALKDFNGILAVSHFTGHSAAGIGAAIKNVGMGLGSKAGKLEMHQAFNLRMNSDVCRGCGKCHRECPANAITLKNQKAKINYQKCISCGRCISECPFSAIEIPWGDSSSNDLQEKIAEYAFGALLGRKAFFINVLTGITARCDCARDPQVPIIEDVGILASEDIVAIDQASLDLAGKEIFIKPGMDPQAQIDYAARIGLGSKGYQITLL